MKTKNNKPITPDNLKKIGQNAVNKLQNIKCQSKKN